MTRKVRKRGKIDTRQGQGAQKTMKVEVEREGYTMRKKGWNAVLIISILAFGVFTFSSRDAEANKEIVIGNVADLTGSTASVGVPTGNGRENYFDFINSRGGVLGYKIKSVFLDGGESITSETRQFNRLVTKDQAIAILGWSTQGTRALMPVATREGITYLGQTCSRDVVQPEKYPYTFIFSPTYLDQFKIAMDYAKKNGGKDIAILREDLDAWKIMLSEGLVEDYAKKIGLNIKDVIGCAPKANDVTSQMLQVQALNPDYLLIPNVPDSLIAALRDGIKIGFPPRKIIGASLWTTHPVIAKKLGKEIEGYVAVSTLPLYGEDNGIMREINEYKKDHADAVSKFEGQTFYIHGWMQGKMFAKAIEAVIKGNGGKFPDDLKGARKQFRDAYQNLKGKIMAEDLPEVDNRDHKGWHSAFLASPEGGIFVRKTDWMYVK